MATITFRVDDNLKSEMERVCDEIGISVSSACAIFTKKFVQEEGFPFDLKCSKPIVDFEIKEADNNEERLRLYMEKLSKIMKEEEF